MPRRLLFGVVLAAALTGCGGDDSADPAPVADAPASGEAQIDIENFRYAPPTLTVTPGQQVTVTNLDEAPHTLTTADDSIDSGDLGEGQSFMFTAPDEPGTVPYICDLHQYMKGEIVVS